ncbi:MAG: hypothetical protein ABGW50_01595 [Thermococcus sp.]
MEGMLLILIPLIYLFAAFVLPLVISVAVIIFMMKLFGDLAAFLMSPGIGIAVISILNKALGGGLNDKAVAVIGIIIGLFAWAYAYVTVHGEVESPTRSP